MAGFYARLAPALLDVIEAVLVLAALGLILFRSRKGSEQSPSFLSVERWFSRVARKKSVWVFLVLMLVLV
jgi:hypothetical protein